jgi:hypothetical protein
MVKIKVNGICPAVWPTWQQLWRWYKWWMPSKEFERSKTQKSFKQVQDGYDFLFQLISID